MKVIIGLVLVMVLLVSAGCPAAAPETTTPVTPTSTTTIANTTQPVTATTTAPASTSITPTTPAATQSPTAPSITTTPAVSEGTLQQRLDLLAVKMEQQRQTQHIPGMALAVVKDDKVVLVKGFGVSDLEKNTPVTPETIFPIGSTTKAFTSTLVGMLVDEGKMDWHDPVTQYLPYFDLKIQDGGDAQVELVDVMSHRTGFPRMSILMASGKIPFEEILHDAVKAEPYAPFRQSWYYSNEVYMSAGAAAAQAAGSTWDSLVEDRIFTPLGMESSTTTFAEVQGNSELSLGYLWDADSGQYKNKPLRNMDNIGPAGAINSTAVDMAEWLRFQLNKGEYDGKRLMSEVKLLETRKSYISMGQGVDYGLGWMLRGWNGEPVVEHGGNVDGFSAEVAMLPESNLGFVLLTNSSVNALPQIAPDLVWETLEGKWEGTPTPLPPGRLDPYPGKYTANFGSFSGDTFTVLVQNNHLAVDIPGQMVYELKEPDISGKWYFAITDQIAVSFDKNEQGQVTGMKMYQAGLVFELPKEGIEIKPEIALAELQQYLGSYQSEQLGMTVNTLIQNNRLAVDIPGQMVFELNPPDASGKWVFRAANFISVKFNRSTGGEIVSMTMFQAGQEFEMKRVEGKKLPTLDEIMDLRKTAGREKAFDTNGIISITGSVYFPQSGVNASVKLTASPDGRYRVDTDYGKYGASSSSFDGAKGWSDSSFGPFEEVTGTLLEQLKMGHPRMMYGDWRKYYDSVRVVKLDTLNGVSVCMVELKAGSLPTTRLYVDISNGDVLRAESMAIGEGGIGIPFTTTYEDYREVNGLRVAFKETSTNEQTGRSIATYQKIETNVKVGEGFFVLTPSLSTK